MLCLPDVEMNRAGNKSAIVSVHLAVMFQSVLTLRDDNKQTKQIVFSAESTTQL